MPKIHRRDVTANHKGTFANFVEQKDERARFPAFNAMAVHGADFFRFFLCAARFYALVIDPRGDQGNHEGCSKKDPERVSRQKGSSDARSIQRARQPNTSMARLRHRKKA